LNKTIKDPARGAIKWGVCICQGQYNTQVNKRTKVNELVVQLLPLCVCVYESNVCVCGWEVIIKYYVGVL